MDAAKAMVLVMTVVIIGILAALERKSRRSGRKLAAERQAAELTGTTKSSKQ